MLSFSFNQTCYLLVAQSVIDLYNNYDMINKSPIHHPNQVLIRYLQDEGHLGHHK